MNHIWVPRWIIYQSSYSQGHRLDKLKLFEKPPEEKKTNILSNIRDFRRNRWNSVMIVKSEREKTVDAARDFDYENWEYRFSIPDVRGNSVKHAICRGCLSVIPMKGTPKESRDARRQHAGACGCFTKLVKSYNLLLRDGNCVICDKHTLTEEWGVPLCKDGSTCRQIWMFEEPQPESLRCAMAILERGA